MFSFNIKTQHSLKINCMCNKMHLFILQIQKSWKVAIACFDNVLASNNMVQPGEIMKTNCNTFTTLLMSQSNLE